MQRRLKIKVFGMVQGVGFRPFVADLARELSISGKVKNNGGRVEILAAGEEKAMEVFLRRLSVSAPEGALVTSIETEEPDALDTDVWENGFFIVRSTEGEETLRRLPVDLATCASCERELFEAGNRRYRHPFISCQSCGPRYSIMKRVPYDRENVTMVSFPMCGECEEEYGKPGDRRRHAQTICCKDCGPQLFGIGKDGRRDSGEEALSTAVSVIKSGGIVAVKDIGGFHFTFLPDNEPARKLREFKSREKKPFAVCFRDMASIVEWCVVSGEEERLLTSSARPIVLLSKKKDFPEEVLKGSSRIGAMLPCNPLQLLLLSETDGPLVMTSGNRGDEPIIIHTREMERLLSKGCPDYILSHEREILSPLDDSIFQVTELPSGEIITQVLRRARGIVPDPIILNQELKNEVFAAGGDLKAVFGFGKGKAAYLSQHFGDLYELSCEKAREYEIDRMRSLFSFRPEKSVADLHPAYLSGKKADQKIQHHQAHVLSVMAEHDLKGKILGIAFDGTGYAAENTIWGSEFLICEGREFHRAGGLRPVLLPGGDRGARKAELSLAGFLYAAGESIDPSVAAAIRAEIGTVRSSSMGRLFDAAASVLQVCTENTYEGQCAAELEQCAEKAEQFMALELSLIEEDGIVEGDGAALIASMKKAAWEGAGTAELALGFHRAVALFTVETAKRIAEREGIRQIAVSGGSFVNRILLKLILPELMSAGYEVFWNEKVPCGDGGLALGQIFYSVL